MLYNPENLTLIHIPLDSESPKSGKFCGKQFSLVENVQNESCCSLLQMLVDFYLRGQLNCIKILQKFI